eukprot:m.242182 g.242182  ORF g.242182 m.242182 type:complete len:220 (-) comp19436_c0_seq18:497-1156(-)
MGKKKGGGKKAKSGGKSKKGSTKSKKGSKKGKVSKTKTKASSESATDEVTQPLVLRGAHIRVALKSVDFFDQEMLPCNFDKVVNIGITVRQLQHMIWERYNRSIVDIKLYQRTVRDGILVPILNGDDNADGGDCSVDEHVGSGGVWTEGPVKSTEPEEQMQADTDDDALADVETLLSLGGDACPLEEATANPPTLTLYYDYGLTHDIECPIADFFPTED